MNTLIVTVLCLIMICKGNGICQNLTETGKPEPGKYPGIDTCTRYIVCIGEKGKAAGAYTQVSYACPDGTKFERYQRECVAEDKVDCFWCNGYMGEVEDPTSKAHFFACVGPHGWEYAQRFKCNKGDFNPETKLCGGTPKEMKVMNLKTDATLDNHKNKTAFAEEARKKVPVGTMCRPCRPNYVS